VALPSAWEARARKRRPKPGKRLTQPRRADFPAGRFGHPDEFGAACAYLCSVQAGFITGQNIVLDGGAFPGLL
jgi:3-oxoacyl-[acyl-carrier protein] reductase